MKRNIEISKISNGITVVSDRIDHVDSITLGSWFNVGARDEGAKEGGAAHFLEHMAFKGTKRRSARQIAEEVEAVGGYMNAYTGKERTAYHFRLLKENLAIGVDILGDILQNSIFDKAEFERERGVILQEIGQSEDTPDDIIFDRFQSNCYANQAMGFPILGEASRIKTFQSDDISNFLYKNYAKANMVVACAGNVHHEKLCMAVEKEFSAMQPQPRQEIIRKIPEYTPLEHRENRANEQVHLLLGFQGVGFLHQDYITLNLLSNILGGGMSSRLFQRIREEMGLVYSIYSTEMTATDSGLFAIYAGTGEEEVKTLLPALGEEIVKIQENITLAELERTKAQIRSALLMGKESTTHRAEQIAHHLQTYQRIISEEEILAKIDAITPTHVMEAAQKIFASPPALTSLGPIQNVPYLETLKNSFHP